MFIGIDIGGTNTKIGIVSKLGRVVAFSTFKSKMPRDVEDFVKDIYFNVNQMLKAESIDIDTIEGIGVGVPGVVNEKNIIVASVNMGWHDLDLASLLKKYFNKPIYVGNDANVAMLAEWKFGSAKGANNAILITLGTGIGSGIILNGKLFTGTHGMGGECGHMVIKKDGIPCNCGNRGCWEQYASAKALARRTQEVAEQNPQSIMNEIIKKYTKASGHTCFEGAKRGDKVAKQLVDEYIDYIVCGLINLTQIFHPEVFVIGGGVAKEGPQFIKMIDTKLNEFLTKNQFEPKVAVKHPVLENNAGVVGAACLAMDR